VQKYSHSNLPQLREVNVPAVASDKNNVIAVYKDLDQPKKDFAANEKKHLIIAVVVFVILGLGIMMGQKFSQSRGVASADMKALLPEGAETTVNEHYHFDKSCYKGANGETVCMTRTSSQNH